MIFERKRITATWGALILLTLLSAFIGERVTPGTLIVLLICATVALKGSLVIEYLMGLRVVGGAPRRLMLCYFFFLPLLISLSILFPEFLFRLTNF